MNHRIFVFFTLLACRTLEETYPLWVNKDRKAQYINFEVEHRLLQLLFLQTSIVVSEKTFLKRKINAVYMPLMIIIEIEHIVLVK